MSNSKLKVGDKLFLSSNVQYESSGTFIVISVGRKYAVLAQKISNEERFWNEKKLTMSDMCVYDEHTGSIIFAAYPSEEVYQTKVAVSEAWTDFVSTYRYSSAPPGMTLEKIEQIKQIIGESCHEH